MKLNKNTGLSDLVLIIFIAAFISLILAMLYIRILRITFSVRSLSDSVQTSYLAETEANDLIYRISNKFNVTFPIVYESQGTKVEITQPVNTPTDNTFTITISRPFATNIIEVRQNIKNSSGQGFTDAEIVLSLDCTTSMNECVEVGCGTGTKLENQTQAVINLAQKLKDEGSSINLGVSVFRRKADWVSSAIGDQLTPSTDYDKIINIMSTRFTDNTQTTEVCTDLGSSSSRLGQGYRFINEYYAGATYPDPDKVKKVGVLISDGATNSPSTPISSATDICPEVSNSCTGRITEEYICKPNSTSAYCIEYLMCNLADTNTVADELCYTGQRDPSVDAYMVTIDEDNPSVSNLRQIHYTNVIFEKYVKPENKYNISDATLITDRLITILELVNTTINTFRIRPN